MKLLSNRAKRSWLLIGGVTAVLLYLFTLKTSIQYSTYDPEAKLINDVSRLNPTHILDRQSHTDIEGLREALRYASVHDLPVSIAGKQHSMGGHTFYPDGIVLDMSQFNRVLSVNPEEKTVMVQSGATWDDVIVAVQPYGLALTVLQDYSGFTVGGSMSVNVHQSDPHYGPMVETIKSFRFLTADGALLNVSREENQELFSLVVGGYGLFGVILDATLQLTDDVIYQKAEQKIVVNEYDELFYEIQKTPEIENVFARLSIVPGEGFLDELLVTTYQRIDNDAFSRDLLPDSNLAMKKFVFGLSRQANWGKRFRWWFQKNYSHLAEPEMITRNNLDKQDVSFLAYQHPKKTDILQEYFVPRSQLIPFIRVLKENVVRHESNLLSATIRYVPRNDETVLSYANKANEMFGVVLYFNVGLSEKEQARVTVWTRELIDETIKLGGTFYLPYELYATSEQIRVAYPRFDEFIERKKFYDPQERFMNEFYGTYAR